MSKVQHTLCQHDLELGSSETNQDLQFTEKLVTDVMTKGTMEQEVLFMLDLSQIPGR